MIIYTTRPPELIQDSEDMGLMLMEPASECIITSITVRNKYDADHMYRYKKDPSTNPYVIYGNCMHDGNPVQVELFSDLDRETCLNAYITIKVWMMEGLVSSLYRVSDSKTLRGELEAGAMWGWRKDKS